MSNQNQDRHTLGLKYNSARINLIIAIGITLLNIVMIFFGSDTYLLFSITIPYVLVFMGAFLCGIFPLEFYEDTGIYEFLDITYLVVFLVVAILVLLIYFLCWLFSKKRVGFLIAALVLFVLDTAFLIWNSGIAVPLVDLLFHGWIIYYLVSGTIAYYKLKKLESEPEPVSVGYGYSGEDGTDGGDFVDSTDSYGADNAYGTDGGNTDNTESSSGDPFDYSDRDSQGL